MKFIELSKWISIMLLLIPFACASLGFDGDLLIEECKQTYDDGYIYFDVDFGVCDVVQSYVATIEDKKALNVTGDSLNVLFDVDAVDENLQYCQLKIVEEGTDALTSVQLKTIYSPYELTEYNTRVENTGDYMRKTTYYLLENKELNIDAGDFEEGELDAYYHRLLLSFNDDALISEMSLKCFPEEENNKISFDFTINDENPLSFNQKNTFNLDLDYEYTDLDEIYNYKNVISYYTLEDIPVDSFELISDGCSKISSGDDAVIKCTHDSILEDKTFWIIPKSDKSSFNVYVEVYFKRFGNPDILNEYSTGFELQNNLIDELMEKGSVKIKVDDVWYTGFTNISYGDTFDKIRIKCGGADMYGAINLTIFNNESGENFFYTSDSLVAQNTFDIDLQEDFIQGSYYKYPFTIDHSDFYDLQIECSIDSSLIPDPVISFSEDELTITEGDSVNFEIVLSGVVDSQVTGDLVYSGSAPAGTYSYTHGSFATYSDMQVSVSTDDNSVEDGNRDIIVTFDETTLQNAVLDIPTPELIIHVIDDDVISPLECSGACSNPLPATLPSTYTGWKDYLVLNKYFYDIENDNQKFDCACNSTGQLVPISVFNTADGISISPDSYSEVGIAATQPEIDNIFIKGGDEMTYTVEVECQDVNGCQNLEVTLYEG